MFEGQFRHNRRAGGRARVTYPGGAVRSIKGFKGDAGFY